MALDPSYFFYSEGTISLTNGSDIATGEFTAWDPAVLPFDFVYPNDGTAGMSVIKEVLAMDQIQLAKPWTGPTLTGVPYFMVRWTRHTDPRIYAVRVSDYLTRLKAIPDNIEEVAAGINADTAAVAAAMVTLAQIQSDVDADRQAAETAAGTAQGSASAAAGSAQTAQQWAEAASSAVLPDNGVTNAKLADMAAGTVKMRLAGAGAGDPIDGTGAQFRDGVQALGAVIDRAYAEYTLSPALTAVIPPDATKPQISEGTQILALTYTPKSATNRIRVRSSMEISGGAASLSVIAAIFDGRPDCLRSAMATLATANFIYAMPLMEYEYVPGSTAPITFSVRVGPVSAGTVTVNGTVAFGTYLGGSSAAVLVVEEIKA